MKKYFAKYLPVEGEIKEGNNLQTRDGIYPIVKHPSNGVLCYRILNGTYHDIQDWHRQVKLFLCSRDIQAGDTFTDNVGRLWENAEECFAKVAREANEQNSEYGKGSYKVIGEILTPGIVENQEFTEKEVEYLTIK